MNDSALERLVRACEVAFSGPAMSDHPDADDVSTPAVGITFGMIRAAREELLLCPSCGAVDCDDKANHV